MTNKTEYTFHGRSFEGVVVSAKAQRTVTVEWERRKYVTKYERYLKDRTRVQAHNPDSIDAKEGDVVVIKECRPISKTKHFVVVKKLGQDFIQLEKSQQGLDPAKKQPKEAKE